MAKQNVMINIDSDILKRFDRAIGKGNRSEAVSKYMQTYSLTKDDNVDGINAEIIRHEILDLNKKISDTQAEREKKQSILDAYYKKKNEAEQKELRLQREKLQVANKCLKCGNLIDSKKHKVFPKGLVCQSCFLAASGEDVKGWQ